MTIRHLSASSIQDFLDCPLRWHGRRVARWPEQKPPFFQQAAALGRAVHSAISAHHAGRDAETALVTCWATETASCLARSVSVHDALPLVRQYAAAVPARPGDRGDVRFDFEIPGVPVPIIGYVDVLSGSHVREVKTTRSAKSWTQADIDRAVQGSVYWLALLRSGMAKRPRLTYTVLRIGRSEPEHYETTRSDADTRQTEMLIRGVYERMTDGTAALEARCRPGYCGFPAHCAEYGYTGPERRSIGGSAPTLVASRGHRGPAALGGPVGLD